MAKARNILLIVVDQWRGDSLGVLGHPAARTPNLDRLAAEGVLFRNHFTQGVPCAPGRASLLTGLYVANHRVVTNGVPLDKRHTNLAIEARRGGYDPLMIGYTTSTPDPRGLDPADRRFRVIGDMMDGWRVFAHFDEMRFSNYFAWVARNGYALPDDPEDVWLPAEGPAGPTDGPGRIPAELSDTAWSTERGLEALTALSRRSPWLLHLGYYRPHPPFVAPAPWHAAVPPGDIPPPVRASSREAEATQHPVLRRYLDRTDRKDFFQGDSGPVAALDLDEVRRTRQAYFGLIAELDHSIGRIFDHLHATGQWDDTLIVLTSDHGELLGDHHLFGKHGYFDQSYHIPLIVRDPSAGADATRGRIVDAVTGTVDVMPTLLEWAGLPVPRTVDGRSLLPFLHGAGPREGWDETVFEFDLAGGYPDPTRTPDGVPFDRTGLVVLRGRRWKYVHFAAYPPLLFDLENDPHEFRNLADDPGHAGVVAECAGRLLTWRMRIADRSLARYGASPDGLYDRHAGELVRQPVG